MSRVAVFLRAINIGGRRVTNDRLAAVVTAGGFADVTTFLASGNLVVEPGGRSAEETAAAVEAAIEAGLGYPAEAFVRTATELDAIVSAVPFSEGLIAEATAAPQVAFLRAVPDAEVVDRLHELATSTDHLRVIGREVHWLPMGGLARSPLNLTTLTKLAGPHTVRTIGTVQRLRAKLD